MASLVGSIELPATTGMQRLGRAAQRVEALKEELKSWQEEYDNQLQAVLETNPAFAESKFLKAAHAKGQMYKADGIGIIRTPVVRRTIRQDEFIERYPEIFSQIGVVAIKDAEAAIGKDKLSELVDLETTYRYKVVSMEAPSRPRSRSGRLSGLRDPMAHPER